MITRETLDNGLTLVTETMPHLRSVAVGVWVRRGSRHEAAGQSGISHFIEHMVFKGTRTRSAERIAAEVDSIGGYMDAFTAKEYASFHLKVLDENLPQAIEILGDIVLNPLFDVAEMAKEKKVIFEEINMVEDTPDDLVMELLSEAFWPDHPLGRPILGNKRTVAGFAREDLLAYFGRVYQPGNLLIAAAGHLEHARAAQLVRRHFAGLRRRPSAAGGRPPRTAWTTVSRSKRELEQVHVCLGTRALPQAHRDRYAGFVLNTVLGGSMSSRLFQNVRERRGLVYSISSGITSYSDAGLLNVYAGTSLDSAAEVIRLTLDEMRRLCGDRLPDEELRRAKDHIKGGLVLSLENTGARMSHLARQEIYFGKQLPLDEILEGIEAVSADDVRRLAARLFRGRVAASVIGNLKGWRPRDRDLVV
ncbi:MAG TPA: pitrilysin family protein [Vicinamibacteria bacterium]|nr:pitrilysin family protein [Vicinamibacteria bacterium]